MKRIFAGILCLGLVLSAGCYYSTQSIRGTKISSTQVQELKLGKTTERDLLNILGQPAKKEINGLDLQTFLYANTEVQSLTLPGGAVMHGFLEKERDEIFEVILKDGVVQSYQFLK